MKHGYVGKGLSWPPDLLKAAQSYSAEKKLSLSGYVQSLVIADLRRRGLVAPDDLHVPAEPTLLDPALRLELRRMIKDELEAASSVPSDLRLRSEEYPEAPSSTFLAAEAAAVLAPYKKKARGPGAGQSRPAPALPRGASQTDAG